MAQTNLKSDAFCSYNSAGASPFYYTFQPSQYFNTYQIGEVGVPAGGGSAGSYIRPDVIDISSFLSGRDDVLSRCVPPVPSLDSLRVEPLRQQDENITSVLLPKYTRNLRSENSLDAVDYNRWNILQTEPQNLRQVIEDFSAERGGLATKQFVKNSWNNQNNLPNFDKNLCKTMLDPSRTSAEGSELITGYPGTRWNTGEQLYAKNIQLGKPPGEPNYPFTDVTSQQVFNVNNHCGEQQFSGPNYDQGSCPKPYQSMFN